MVLQFSITVTLGAVPLLSFSQELVQEFNPINEQMGLMAVSSDGSFFALGGGGKISLRWTQSGEEWQMISESGVVNSNPRHRPVDISSDDSLLAWVAHGAVRVFDLKSGKTISDFSSPENFRGPGIKFHPDSHQLAVSSLGGVELMDVISGETIQRIYHPDARPNGNIVFSKDGRLLAYGGGSRGLNTLVHIFDLTQKKTVRVIKTSNTYGVPDVDLSDDGKWLATGVSDNFDDQGQMVEIWDVLNGNVIGRIPGRCEFLHFMDEGRFLVVLRTPSPQDRFTLPDQLQLWRVQDMKLMKSIELEGRRGEYPARYTMLGSQDYSGVVVQYFGDTVWIEGNGEFRPVMPTYIGLVSIPPMISSLSHTATGSLSLEWSSGLAPFQLLFRENLDESWSTIERGIVTRSITIPLDNTKSGFYGIRSTK